MKPIYIPIGMQCSAAQILKNMGKRDVSLPFDWILSHPKFILECIKAIYQLPDDQLLDFFLDLDNQEISSIPVGKCEHYFTVQVTPKNIYNRKHKVTFPHQGDDYSQPFITTFQRRIARLKTILLEGISPIRFFYVSPPNPRDHYSINGEILTANVTPDLNQLCEFLLPRRPHFRLAYLDCLGETTATHDLIDKIPFQEMDFHLNLSNTAPEHLLTMKEFSDTSSRTKIAECLV